MFRKRKETYCKVGFRGSHEGEKEKVHHLFGEILARSTGILHAVDKRNRGKKHNRLNRKHRHFAQRGEREGR